MKQGNFRVGWLLTILALLKGAIWVFILVGVWCMGDMDRDNFFGVAQRWPREGGPIFASHFATWDTAHYLFLSEVGYRRSVDSCAFYPLWPLLVRWTSPLAGGNHLLAGLVLSNLFSLAAWVLFYERVRRSWGGSVAAWALVFLIVFPGSLFFQFHYTESLFLLLVMLLWWGIEERRWGLACVAAFLLPVCRAVGLFSMLPIGWFLLGGRLSAWGRAFWSRRVRRKNAVEPQDRDSDLRSNVRDWRWYGLLLAPLLGWLCYLGLMTFWTGNPFEGFEAQKNWRVHSISNLWNVPKFVWGFLTPT